ncbi:ankyrin repeat and SAM domain-containing protein 6-like [Clavelina lepadiformis]|uniref:ankyrin repeat and SAM domain-containing protein 6-like n=1 Tax=Clavelina lepadiformis TaxID=159417 RepID=UPI004040FC3D
MDTSLSVSQIHSLLAAVEIGELSKVQMLLEQGISVETTDVDGNSLLHIAAANGHEDIVRLLSIKGASLDRPNLYGWTPLMQASRHGYEKVVKHLLNNKAKVNATTPIGISALTLAIHGGHTKLVDFLLGNNEIVLDDAENVTYFTSPLAVATMYGRDDALRSLLRLGVPADQNFKYTEWTPLMIAALTGQLPMARLLVDRGANANFKNKQGKTALEIATDCEKTEVRGYLDRKTTDKPARVADKGDGIILAVKARDYSKVANILKNDRIQANKASSDGATPLMYASINGQLNMIKLLIDCGADIDAKDYENGWTALMQATYYGKNEAAIFLIQCGANVHIPARNGVTAFDMAMLINLHDTRLFRLLAEKVMQGKRDNTGSEPTQLTKAWEGTGTGSLLSDAQTQINKSPVSTLSGTKRGIWSRMTRSVKGMKLTRTFKKSILPNKVVSFEETLVAPDETDPSGENKYKNNGEVAGGDPYTMTHHSAPTNHFPSEKLSPVVPPFQSNTGVDKQSMATQRKLSGSKSSMSNSLNSSGGESSVSRSVVRPNKFLQSPNSSGRYNTGLSNSHSPHSSGGAPSVSHSFTYGHQRTTNAVEERHNHSGDRHSDTALDTMAKRKQRKIVSSPASVDGVMSRNVMPTDQLLTEAKERAALSDVRSYQRHNRSRAGSIASSQSTGSTLTPPRSPRSFHMDKRSNASSRGSRSIKSSSSSKKRPPSLSEEDEINNILQKLSLEKYQPIFEQEEIDMDAFLSLTQGDLRELGITQELPRRQILQAISKINVEKDSNNEQQNSVEITSNKSVSQYAANPKPGSGTSAWSYNHSSPRIFT